MRTMTSTFLAAGLSIAALTLSLASAHAVGLQQCATNGSALGVSRIVEIDTSTGALFGAISTQVREARFLAPKEVVLTFDDGPMPPVTRSILDTLDRFCTKATFFSVGKMALAYPGTVKSILERGHTLGTHTWSHPLTLRRLSLEKSNEEIEKGFAAVTLAAGEPIAPFFRFPGLSDSAPMLKHLQQRGIAAFTVDAVSNDSYISDPDRLLANALKEIEAQKGGIVLFHDIKPATARMLPKFLTELQKRGFTIVHMRAKSHVEPSPEYAAKLAPLLAKSEKTAAAPGLVPFYGLVKPGELAHGDTLPVTEIAPAVRIRATSTAHVVASKTAPSKTAVRGWSARAGDGAPVTGPTFTPGLWGTVVAPDR